MSTLSHVVAEASRLQSALRFTLSQSYHLAYLRSSVRARTSGKKLLRERDTVIVYDEQCAVRACIKSVGDVWEAAANLAGVFSLALPNAVWRAPDGTTRELLDISRPAEHTLRRSGQRYRFTTLPESDAANELYLELARLEPGAVVFDCGAYCGASTCAFSRAVGPSGRVIAFEPDGANWAALQTNLAAHEAANVTAENKGVWSSSTTLRFAASGNMGARISLRPNVLEGPTCAIETTSLADAYLRHGLTRLDFIKMDIEGAEIAALEAARELLQQTRPRLVVEAHLVDGALATGRLLQLFDQIGFTAIIVLESERSPYHLIYASPRARHRVGEGHSAESV